MNPSNFTEQAHTVFTKMTLIARFHTTPPIPHYVKEKNNTSFELPT